MTIPRLYLCPAGVVDEVVVECAEIELQRSGAARYLLSIRGGQGEAVDLVLWTSQRGCIEVRVRDQKDWVTVTFGADGTLEMLIAKMCLVHLEQMDRRCYWIGLSRGDSYTHIDFWTRGYIKTKIIHSTVAVSRIVRRDFP